MDSGLVAFLHRVDDIQHASVLPGAVVLLVLLGVAVYAQPSKKRTPAANAKLRGWFTASASLFAGLCVTYMLLGFGIEWFALKNIRPRLFAPILSVQIDGRPLGRPDAFVADLRGVAGEIGHHSHTVRDYRIVLHTARGPLTLTLGRDSSDPMEYWVADPSFHSGYLGRIHTDQLNDR